MSVFDLHSHCHETAVCFFVFCLRENDQRRKDLGHFGPDMGQVDPFSVQSAAFVAAKIGRKFDVAAA